MKPEKKWTRADVRSEIARIYKSTADSSKVYLRTSERIRALGAESGFEDDALDGIRALRRDADKAIGPAKMRLDVPPQRR